MPKKKAGGKKKAKVGGKKKGKVGGKKKKGSSKYVWNPLYTLLSCSATKPTFFFLTHSPPLRGSALGAVPGGPVADLSFMQARVDASDRARRDQQCG